MNRTAMPAAVTLDTGGIIGLIGGLVSVLAFVFSIWIWYRSETRTKELTAVIQSIYDISGSIIWETVNLGAEDTQSRLRQAERALGLASSINTLASKYTNVTPGYRATELGVLIERGIVWSNSMMWNLETSADVKEVWLVTPDLKPDLDDSTTGALVRNNIRQGKRYVYFIPDDLADRDQLVSRLRLNIGPTGARRRSARGLQIVPIPRSGMQDLFHDGNTVMFFRGDPTARRGDAFRELRFTKVSERGLFWQECSPDDSEREYRFLLERVTAARNAAGT
jgi:hypothetical protein